MVLFQRSNAVVVPLLVVLGAVSCEDIQVGKHPAPSGAPPTQAVAPAQKPDSVALPVGTVDLLETSLAKSSTVPLGGDLRPVWRVQGRIYNNSDYKTVSSVKIRVFFVEGDGQLQLDGDDMDIKISIPPSEMRAFVREVRLLPPSDKRENYEWGSKVVEVRGEP
jgi:hypothetical protein